MIEESESVLLTIGSRIRTSQKRIWYPDPDPAIFISDHQEGKKYSYIYIIFHRWKVKKKLQNSRNKGFSSYYCLMIEGSKSVPLKNGARSGFRRAKYIWILRIRIWARNTGSKRNFFSTPAFLFFNILLCTHVPLAPATRSCGRRGGGGRGKGLSIAGMVITLCKTPVWEDYHLVVGNRILTLTRLATNTVGPYLFIAFITAFYCILHAGFT